jgi:hypothetical protein
VLPYRLHDPDEEFGTCFQCLPNGPTSVRLLLDARRTRPPVFNIIRTVIPSGRIEPNLRHERLRQQGVVDRLRDGEWHLTEGA